jgi:ribosome-associated protein
MEQPSKSQRKREMLALQALGERLVALPAARLEALALLDELRDAVLFARSLTARGARKRQLQYIGRLMRGVDPEFAEELRRRLG